MEAETKITNPAGDTFIVRREKSRYKETEPGVVFYTEHGHGTGASYFVSNLIATDHDLDLHGDVPSWWISRQNILQAIKALFEPYEIAYWASHGVEWGEWDDEGPEAAKTGETAIRETFPVGTRVFHMRYKAGPWPVTGYDYDSKGVFRVEVGGDTVYLPEDLAIVPELGTP